mmetsp:Transcript_11591/g.25394  ORF Transcript_11591/g.25394 Transcript_11591/m.25394 type:complete len:219 (-) Transcript_11591:309-965(-)|eukprot:CAMPEP_0113310824 /NCGR_PEP_ID=MMETSP0010_2-20120614/8315_1 /TAXON_ID=216773 ORGANISM="Corethron hystrix, Strain 308" /NCGR_SAMPLE_ID=MMETSP0010_2 /ASSEMBLY_ACC=CAM_ASM_000155 /LENGTH=218 /DNA_ID=CAMNT_0000166357 /DNA_START=198 /DNA_END=854 /DNA_ORIENTATION=- /assembly_acc=CAM_ASM_000155
MPSVHNILSVSMVFSTILVPAHAQFGVPKKGTGFEELNDQAQKLNEVGVDALGGIGGLGDLGFGTAGGDYGKALEDMMDKLTPAQKKELEQYGENANEAVNNIMNMDPSELSAKMNDVMATMDDEEELKKAIGEPDVLIKQLENSGMVTEEQLEKYRANPDQLYAEVKDMMGVMKNLMGDPDKLASMMDGVKKLMKNPEAALEMMGQADRSLGGMQVD